MRIIRERKFFLITTVLCVIPIFLWATMQPLSARFGTNYLILTSLGQITGLAGLVVFSINFILAGRFAFMENFFGGVNKMYVYHQKTGKSALIILLIHPFLLTASQAVISLDAVATFLTPGPPWSRTFGTIALIILVVLVSITLYVKNSLKYETWKLTHKLLGLSLFFASLHVLLIPSDITINPFLRIYILGFAALAIASYLYRVLLGNWLIKRYTYKVTATKKVAKSVIEITLSPTNQSFSYKSGQFIFVRFLDKQFGREIHPFSISSQSGNGELTITVKQLGDFTRSLSKLRKGMQAQIEGPYGKFTFSNYPNKKQIWIAGGIGITPFVGMARELQSKDYKVDLYYSVKFKEQAAYLEELSRLSKTNKNFRLIKRFTDAEGLMDLAMIKKKSGSVTNKDIFLCGPPGMMRFFRKQFLLAGVQNSQIHSEEFAL